MSQERPDGTHERRLHPRFETEFTGTLSGAGKNQCRVLNISRSGAYALSSQAIPEMAEVEVKLQVEDPDSGTETLTCQAAVVRCDRRPDGNYDLGLFFTSIDPSDQILLERIIESHAVASAPR